MTAAAPTPPDLILPALADLLGCGAGDLRPLLPQLIAAWTAEDGSGAIALRRTPRADLEVLGGARPGPRQTQVALTLLRAAMTSGATLSAYADDALLPGEALRRLGWRQAGQFTDWRGPLPTLDAPVPEGVRILPLAAAEDLTVRREAQATYADRLGHTLVGDTDLIPGAHGSDDTVGHVAVDASGQGVGICRAWLDGDTLTIGSPGVHPAWRHTTLRHALLRATGDAARQRGARHLIMQAWGDTPAETQADAELGLTAATVTPIHLSR
ncbi:hypothetical protein DEIGR_101118 [Deinococcus grandis]|uniref:N-acetyltransferase domain-containing protein n=1 Tax=Deinococcus grandis TaxID=57498 RepID=A0A117DN55_9DEIO|nr:hypothetical protein [Deinococcus grandis]BBN95418.1 hypothetical protein DEGR_21510 [Deinococcus grandis]GAQ21091.1 hypothetical protein DEIGR_101118 [Deinococcus grandis]